MQLYEYFIYTTTGINMGLNMLIEQLIFGRHYGVNIYLYI